MSKKTKARKARRLLKLHDRGWDRKAGIQSSPKGGWKGPGR